MAVRELIRLVSEEGTGYFYTTTKNKRTKPDKLRLKKYDPCYVNTCGLRKPRSSSSVRDGYLI